MPSRYETTREPLIKRMFLGDSAPKKREESVLQYIIHCIDKDARPTCTGGVLRQEREILRKAAALFAREDGIR